MMAHSWESPANLTREVLLDILKERGIDLHLRHDVVDLALEEIDRQFAEPDDEMIVAGVAVLDTTFGYVAPTSEFRRRLAVEQIWRAMAEKAFGR